MNLEGYKQFSMELEFWNKEAIFFLGGISSVGPSSNLLHDIQVRAVDSTLYIIPLYIVG